MDPEDDDILELSADEQIEDEAPEQQQAEEQADDDDVVIAFEGDEAEAEQASESSTIREMRARIRELQKQVKATPAQKIEIGKKPDLWEDCEGDPDKFEAELRAYDKRVADAKAQESEENERQQAATAEFETEHNIYREQKARLNRPDFETAEIAIETSMSQAQQSVLLLAAKQKAPLIYAIGKNPKRLAELAKITNPIKLAVAVNELERSLKVTPRKSVEPEERQRGSAPSSISGGEKALEDLRERGRKTGNMQPYLDAKRAAKAKA